MVFCHLMCGLHPTPARDTRAMNTRVTVAARQLPGTLEPAHTEQGECLALQPDSPSHCPPHSHPKVPNPNLQVHSC